MTEKFNSWFGSMPKVAMTLFQVITSGIDWAIITDLLDEVSVMSKMAFFLYIFFTVFCMLNIMTGFYVDQAMKSTERDVEMVANEERGKRVRVIQNLKIFFHEADTAHTGNISWPIIRTCLEDPMVESYFKTLELEEWDLQTFFDLMVSDDGEHTMEIDHFIKALHASRARPRTPT